VPLFLKPRRLKVNACLKFCARPIVKIVPPSGIEILSYYDQIWKDGFCNCGFDKISAIYEFQDFNYRHQVGWARQHGGIGFCATQNTWL